MGGKYDRETYQQAWELYNRGRSISEISRALGIPYSTIHDWIKGGKGRRYASRNKRFTLKDYFKVMELYREHYTPMEICRLTGVPRDIVWRWCIYGQKPREDNLANIGRFSKWIEQHHPYTGDYYRLLYDSTKWPYLAYLYGAVITDGSLYYDDCKKDYSIKITGEKVFLLRVNEMIYNLVGKSYKVRPDKTRDRYILKISRKTLYQIMKLGQERIGQLRQIIEYNTKTMSMFILGLVDGDGYYDKKTNQVCLLKSRRWWIIAYSAYILRKLGIEANWIKQKRKGKSHTTKYGDKIVSKRDRFGWKCDLIEFIEKIGKTIKLIKRNDLPEAIKAMMTN